MALLDLDTDAFTPLNDLRRQLVYCEDGSSVRYTIVNGAVVFDHGRITTVNEKAIRAEIRALMGEYREHLQRANHQARRLEPYYRAMYQRAAAQDVGMNRWLA